jgi:hypothetical protein
VWWGEKWWVGEVVCQQPETTTCFAYFPRRVRPRFAPVPLCCARTAPARMALRALAAAAILVLSESSSFPVPPFDRPLALQSPPVTGLDVYILQNLLLKNGGYAGVGVTSTFDAPTSAGLGQFQAAHGLPATGALDPATASAVLTALSADGYRDDGVPPEALGYLYKVLIPVSSNRSVESTNAQLVAGNGTVLLTFTARLHGADGYPPGPWPTWNNTGPGLNSFSSDGMTPTGLAELDLNSPEDNATEFGPFPINRVVRGLQGNWEWIATNEEDTMVRDGILLHTGNWSEAGWPGPPSPMPNSLGCIHAYPATIATIWTLLTQSLGVQVRPNTDGQLPYPYRCQGLLSIEQVDK